ncbi:serine/threonine-protein kinase [Streptomyces sp. A1136]|uniref:serine/threonine-protein kinase n=1 Tax=Streptomyces sp. A1136 TaxID=2563102 RepID=UPI00109EAD16|nr:serine/threonine-protein kinase [Streptomyces sp. A1136]THA58302.1 serine/threonine protein kinase [Streptomyces sp. A1136]
MKDAWTVPGYTSVRELGAGGSGRVVLSVHDATGTPVAVKYLGDRLREDPAFVREFRAEARLLGGLRSPHVVALYEYCEYTEAPGGAAIVMELVDGISLRALLKRSGSTDPEAALVLLKGSLLGLASAHRAGVVHRDYKPENVLVAADGSSKLVDFGIAAGRGTTPGVAGTPAYMAPEQWQGRPASPAADVYAATATFFECVTGHKPFPGTNFAELAVQHVEAPVPETEAPEPVRPLIRRGLAKAPEERPENAEAFVAELEEVALAGYGPDWEERGQRKLAALAALLPLLFPSAAATASGTTALATTVLPPRPAGLPPGRRGALAAAAVLVIGALLVFTYEAVAGEAGGASALSAFATSSAGPPGGGGPGPGPSASASATPSPSMSPSPSASPSASVSPSASTSPSPTPGSSHSPTPTPTPTPTKPTPTVKPSPSVTVSGVEATLLTSPSTGQVSVSLDVRGGPATVLLEWFLGNDLADLRVADGTDSVPVRAGTEPVTRTHAFARRAGCYLSVRVTTTPSSGKPVIASKYIPRCTTTEPPR